MKRALRNSAIVFLLIVAIFISGIVPGQIKSAKAYSVPNTSTGVWSASAVGTTALTVANVGDLIILNGQFVDPTSSSASQVKVLSISDSFHDSYQLAASAQINIGANCLAGNCLDTEIWYALATSSGSDTITVTISQSTSSAGADSIEGIDVAGPAGSSAIGASEGTGVATGTYTVGTPVPIPSGDIADSSIEAGCSASGVLSAGTGYNFVNPSMGSGFYGSGGAEYGSPTSGPASPTDFPSNCTISTANWIDIGVVFGTVSVSTQVTACSAYNLQCWLYPLFVFGTYLGIIGAIAKKAGVPSRDMIGHILEAFSLAAMVCVLMGILNIMVPLLVVVVQVIRAIRE